MLMTMTAGFIARGYNSSNSPWKDGAVGVTLLLSRVLPFPKFHAELLLHSQTGTLLSEEGAERPETWQETNKGQMDQAGPGHSGE
jgi:hypothetical protein